jgi:hypothetical protein
VSGERLHCPFCGEGYGAEDQVQNAWEAWDALVRAKEAFERGLTALAEGEIRRLVEDMEARPE